MATTGSHHVHILCIYTVFHKKQPLWFFYSLLLCLCQIADNFYLKYKVCIY